MNVNDSHEMIEYMSDENVLKYESFSPFELNYLQEFIKSIEESKEFYSVFLKDTNKLIGHVFLGKSHPITFNEYNLGYIFNPKYHNHGYCTEASKALIINAFNVLKAHRIVARCCPDNLASWHVMQKLGFQKEGLLRNRITFKKDEYGSPIYWDEYVYGLLERDILGESNEC